LNFNGKAFIGFKITPAVDLVWGLAELNLSAKAGIQIKTSAEIINTKVDLNAIHECKTCFEGIISSLVTLSAGVEIFDGILSKTYDFKVIEKKLHDFHYSSDFHEFSFSKCPHYKYRIAVKVYDENQVPVGNAIVRFENKEFKTDALGMVMFYSSGGSHEITASKDGFADGTTILTIDKPMETGVQLRRTSTDLVSGKLSLGKTFNYNGHSYAIFSDVVNTWDEAQAYCKARGGYLAVINDAKENMALFNMIKSHNLTNVYFGYTDKDSEGDWKWVSDDNSTYENWGLVHNEPNGGTGENYAMFYQDDPTGEWNDGDFGENGYTVNSGKTFICEWNQENANTYLLHSKQTYNGHAYQLIDEKMSWTAAKKYCETLGGHLVSITSSGEQKFVESMFTDATMNCYWIGLYRNNSTWKWVDASTYSYTNWDYDDFADIAKPDNHGGSENYGAIYSITKTYSDWKQNFGKWDDGNIVADPGYANGLICEWDSTSLPTKKALAKPDVVLSENVSILASASNASSSDEKTLTYTDLIPNGIYNFYAMKSQVVESPFSEYNLLYVDQYTADKNGKLTVNYTPLTEYFNEDAFLVGMQGIDISDAAVSVQDLTFTGEEQLANVRVVYGKKMLTEGLDYNICDDFIAKDCGAYTINIEGKGIYAGNVKATYTITRENFNASSFEKGDMNLDGEVTVIDVILLQKYLLASKKLTAQQWSVGDLNGDNLIDVFDLALLKRKLLN
jgi:hypothetical protein